MTCVLTTPRSLRVVGPIGGDAEGSTLATGILDHSDPAIRTIVARLGADHVGIDYLRAAHGHVARTVRPVYSMRDSIPASRVLQRRRGSCSQRFGLLEALARANGIRTRVRGLLLDGAYWYPRFPALRRAVPDLILLAWPQFRVDGDWVDAGEIFSIQGEATPFLNEGGETLFDAIGRGAVQYETAACSPAAGTDCGCDVGGFTSFVRQDLGLFDSRDALYEATGENLPRPLRALIEPVFSRWSAGARMPLAAASH